jgi:hypothetical protein
MPERFTSAEKGDCFKVRLSHAVFAYKAVDKNHSLCIAKLDRREFRNQLRTKSVRGGFFKCCRQVAGKAFLIRTITYSK